MRAAGIAAVVGLVAVAATPAFAQGVKAKGGRAPGYYISGAVGTAGMASSTNSGAAVNNSLEYGNGRALAMAAGYAWTAAKRADVELTSRSANVDLIQMGTGARPTATGSVGTVALLANYRWGTERWGWFIPYVSAGIGFARTTFGDVVAAGVPAMSGSAWTLAYQVGVGAEFPMTAHLSLDTSLRLFSADRPKLSDVNGDSFKATIASKDLMVGMRYQF